MILTHQQYMKAFTHNSYYSHTQDKLTHQLGTTS